MSQKNFVIKWVSEFRSGLLKTFPDDFINDIETIEFSMPGIELILGTELFGQYELTDIEGKSILTVENYPKAKYIIYANRSKPSSIKIPANELMIKDVVKNYEKHLDLLLTGLEKEYKKEFPEMKDFNHVSNQIFNSLNLRRH